MHHTAEPHDEDLLLRPGRRPALQRRSGQKSTEPETGVWKDITAHPATINAGGCDAWGNVGAAAIYNGAPVAWANSLGHVDSGQVKVRYVTKDDRAVMALVADGALPAHMRWAFLPRTCLTPAF